MLSSSSKVAKDWLLGAALGICHAALVNVVYRYVPEPYMDEIFHIRQTRRYCNGDWTWDPMITTPPALYLLGMPFCGFERYTNSVLVALTFVGFCRFRRMFTMDSVHTSALVALLFPVSIVCAVVWGFSLDSPFLSSLSFGVAVLTRQTNIVWAGFSAAIRLFRGIDTSKPFSSLIHSLISLASFIILALSFIVFVFINGGIVLGDASAHHPRLHLAQLLYLALFIAIHAWPHALPRLAKLCARTSTNKLLIAAEIISQMVVFSSVFYLFLFKPFEWANEPGAKQRFMW
ncbi:unnamed protein product [Cylicostephanus goldi]|uniref:Dol-P-Glc:Glc(2)Man(9)GlcNAc(2)-PP-Dol alpha-1,2-glucosyltransferase n=1 Tax=Cylicostephanus goldi TaxID=71465 RepID=A0A3P7M7R4_CYLGO|nr:unnamed protein product [Cylicostephanus goldi]